MDRTADLSAKASTTDRDKLDQYLTGGRDLELRLEALETLQCDQPPEPGNRTRRPAGARLWRPAVPARRR